MPSPLRKGPSPSIHYNGCRIQLSRHFWYSTIYFYSLAMAKFKATFPHLSAEWEKPGVGWGAGQETGCSSHEIVSCQINAFLPWSRQFLHVSWSKQGARLTLVSLLSSLASLPKPDIVEAMLHSKQDLLPSNNLLLRTTYHHNRSGAICKLAVFCSWWYLSLIHSNKLIQIKSLKFKALKYGTK